MILWEVWCARRECQSLIGWPVVVPVTHLLRPPPTLPYYLKVFLSVCGIDSLSIPDDDIEEDDDDISDEDEEDEELISDPVEEKEDSGWQFKGKSFSSVQKEVLARDCPYGFSSVKL